MIGIKQAVSAVLEAFGPWFEKGLVSEVCLKNEIML